MKYMSYFEAVKAHAEISLHVYDSSGQVYMDPGNKTYEYTIEKVSPGCLVRSGISNVEKKGDILAVMDALQKVVLMFTTVGRTENLASLLAPASVQTEATNVMLRRKATF